MSLCEMPVLSGVCDLLGDTTASIVTAPFEWLAQAIGNTAAMLFEAVWTVFDQTTLVDISSPGYVAVYNILFGIAIFFMLGFFFLQLITGLIRREPGALSRAALGLAKSVLGSFLVITLTGTLLEIVDQLCIGLIQATGNTIEGMGVKIGLPLAGLAGLTAASPGVGAILIIFFGSLAIAAAAIVWFSLLIRKALLLVAIVLAPIALSGASWDVTRGWFGKWVSFVVALIVSKLVITVVFLVAVTQVDAPIDFDLAELTDPIAGIVLMAIAGFAPYMTYKFVSFLGFDLYHAMSSEQEAKQALNRPLPLPTRPTASPSNPVLNGNDPGADGGSGPSPTPPGTAGTSTVGEQAAPPTPGSGGTGAAPASGSAASGAGASGAAASTGAGSGGAASGGAGAGAAGGAAAAGPAAAVVVAAEVAKKAAEAGPKAGAAISAAADGHLGSAQESASPPPPPTSTPPTSSPPPAPRPASEPAPPSARPTPPPPSSKPSASPPPAGPARE